MNNDLSIEDRVVNALKTVFDPEIPVNVYDLGLIYKIHVDKQGNVVIDMTLTSPGCAQIGRASCRERV